MFVTKVGTPHNTFLVCHRSLNSSPTIEKLSKLILIVLADHGQISAPLWGLAVGNMFQKQTLVKCKRLDPLMTLKQNKIFNYQWPIRCIGDTRACVTCTNILDKRIRRKTKYYLKNKIHIFYGLIFFSEKTIMRYLAEK